MATKLRVGGVPEHFNLPIHLASEKGYFQEKNIEIEWEDIPEGTGAMVDALANDDLDICILLTEGITKAIINGNPSKIISEYVITPLSWGIHTSIDNNLAEHSQIYDKKYAISRFGSGSHLMAIIDATGQEKTIKNKQFNVINDINGALESLKKQETDVFYWEKFTTKPYVDAGILKRVGEFPTPWPSFVIAATENIINKEPEALRQFLKVVQRICSEFMQNSKAYIPMVAERYKLKPEDAENWYHRTEWATNAWISDKMLSSVVYNLKLANIIPKDKEVPQLIWIRDK